MKINKSKRKLAQLLIEVGVTKFPDGANWAAQDKSGKEIYCYKNKPRRPLSWGSWHHDGGVVANGEFQANALIANWHTTVLSRDEFDQIVAETAPDADGWIEWGGAPRSPVSKGTPVDVKMQNGTQHFGQLIDDECWSDCWGDASIIAYRLHKHEKSLGELCGEVKEENKHEHMDAKPTIEQLAADYRNAKDYADRKQREADAAKADADEKLSVLELAGEEIGLMLSVSAKPVYTGRFHSAKHGDKPVNLDAICDGCGKRFCTHVGFDCRP